MKRIIALIVLLVVGCAPNSSLTSEPALPLSSPTSVQEFLTLPSTKSIDTPTLTSTLKPSFTFTATPTINAVSVLALEFDIPSVCLFAYQVSKDRNWIGADCNIHHKLIIAQKETKNKTEIPYEDILDRNPNVFTIKPLSWSSDNRYFYFTTSIACCFNYNENNQNEGDGALYRYDVVQNIRDVQVQASDESYYFFSDDGERFVYTKQFNYPHAEIEVGMIEILTKKNKRVVLEGYFIEGRDFTWSRNMEKFGVVLWELQFRNNTPGSVLLKIDFTKMDMMIIKEFNKNNLLAEE